MAKNTAGLPKEGDELYEVSCCRAGPVLVRSTRYPEWKCGMCRERGTVTGRFRLDGALRAMPIEQEVSDAEPGRRPGKPKYGRA